MLRISVQLQEGRQKKKGFRREILGFVLAFTRVFVLERDFAEAWGGTSSISGEHGL